MKEKVHTRRRAAADRVLILEGTLTLSQELAHCLIGMGFTVARIPNNSQTLLTFNVFKPDIVIVDETVADSLEVCKQIRKALRTPVLLAGEAPSTDIWTKALIEAGADFYLKKPFDSEVLAAQIRTTLSSYHKTSAGSIQHQNKNVK